MEVLIDEAGLVGHTLLIPEICIVETLNFFWGLHYIGYKSQRSRRQMYVDMKTVKGMVADFLHLIKNRIIQPHYSSRDEVITSDEVLPLFLLNAKKATTPKPNHAVDIMLLCGAVVLDERFPNTLVYVVAKDRRMTDTARIDLGLKTINLAATSSKKMRNILIE